MKTLTTIVVPTFRRPQQLQRCLESCARLSIPEDIQCEVVVVDNSPDADAQAQVTGVARRSPLRIHYSHEPKPGISAARNRGLAQCRGQFVAFLDDDQSADVQWLRQLHRVAAQHDADAVFGAIRCTLPDGSGWAGPVLEKIFGREFDVPEGVLSARWHAQLGTGSSLFDLRCLQGERTFDDALGLSGGEDTVVIESLAARGKRLAWAPRAVADEWIPAERARLRFLLERRFSSGQLRTYQHARSGSSRASVLQWMLIGAAQFAAGTTLAASMFAVGRDGRKALCEAAAGAGKVLWFDRFRVDRYRRSPGLSAAKSKESA